MDPNDEPRLLLAEVNPYGDLEASVEDDGRTVYLYLRHVEKEDWGLRPVWVANRLPAPEAVDVAGMNAGRAPLMPRDGTRFPEGGPPLDEERLSLVWFEEGDGVALLEGDRPIAVLVPWSGHKGFPGYSAAAIGVQDTAWELDQALSRLGPRIKSALAYWQWRDEDASWEEIQSAQMAHLERHLGPHRRYWAADGGQFPPSAVLQFTPPAHPGVFVYATLGMSAQAMPGVEMGYEDPAPYRRVEMALAAREESDQHARLLSTVMGMPWREYSCLGDGHTYTWDEPPAGGVLLLADPPPWAAPACFAAPCRLPRCPASPTAAATP